MKKLLFFYLLLAAPILNAQVKLFVDSSVTTSGNGSSWATAFKTLNEALDQSNSDASNKYVIQIAKGTYYPTGSPNSTDRDSAFVIYQGEIELLGGFPSGGGSRNSHANATILSGNIGDPDLQTDNSHHIMVIAHSSTDAKAVLVEGIFFTGGYADGSGVKNFNGHTLGRNSGGALAILCPLDQADVAIKHCRFINNFSSLNGGAIYADSTKVFMDSCYLSRNTSLNGGAYCAIESYNLFLACEFSENKALHGGGAYIMNPHAALFGLNTFTGNLAEGSDSKGGGVYIYSSDPENQPNNPGALVGCSFTGNKAVNGGGVYAYHSYAESGAPFIAICQFYENTAEQGGGIYHYEDHSEGVLEKNEFKNNRASIAGGALYQIGQTTVKDCTFTEDSAASGGSVFADGGIFTGCTFTGSEADNGGGLYMRTSSDIYNSTFKENKATMSGGAIYKSNDDLDETVLSHLLLSGNVATDGGAIYMDAYHGSLTNSLLSGNKASGSGGAVYNDNSSAEIINCTFAGNAATNGNGLFNTNGSSLQILNSIIWDGENSSLLHDNGSITAVTYSIIQGGYPGTGNMDNDPEFNAPIAASLAPTIHGDYRIKPCSPGVNSGLNTGSYIDEADLDGRPRLIDSDVDRGAYEYQNDYPDLITGPDRLCTGEKVKLNHPVEGGIWSSDNTGIATVDAATGQVTGVAPGDVVISYVSEKNCAQPITKAITVNPLPSAGQINGDNTLCKGTSVTLSTTEAGGTWSNDSPNILSLSGSQVTGISAGTGMVRYTVTSPFGCGEDVAKKSVTVRPVPELSTIPGFDICAGETIVLTNTTAGGTWTVSNTALATIDPVTGELKTLEEGSLNVTYEVTNEFGCSASVSTQIHIYDLPSVEEIEGPDILCIDNTGQFTNQTPSGTWMSGDQNIADIDNSGKVTAISPGTVTISYEVYNGPQCSTIRTRQLTVVAEHVVTTVEAVICAGQTYQFGSRELSVSGHYQHVFNSINGCDSTVDLDLTARTVDKGIIQQGNLLTAVQDDAEYQWIDCEKGNQPIDGATEQTYLAIENGRYAVVLRYSDCIDTSACEVVTGLAAHDHSVERNIYVYPNPSSGRLTVNTGKTASHIALKDLSGRQMQQLKPEGPVTILDLQHYASGMYLIEIYLDGIRYSKSISLSH